jgi:outer membrane immunogenic protein
MRLQAGTGVLSAHNSGFIGGGQIGYNYQFGTILVAGIEADIQGAGARASARAIGIGPEPTLSAILGFPINAVSNLFASNAVDYLGTVRGRFGFLVTPALLIYGDGGFAYGGAHQDITISTNLSAFPVGFTGVSAGFSNTRLGWTAGGGFEWMFLPNWSLKAEYLFYGLGTTTFAAGV